MAIAANVQQQVYDLLSRSSALSFVTADQEGVGRIGLVPGQRVSAQVVANLPNNRTQVRIGAEQFNIDLPTTLRPGQSLEMTFVSDAPRSTFAIARQGGPPPPVSLSDASRLLSLLVSSEQIRDPEIRSSLNNIGDMLRRSPGEDGVLANLLDEALTYGALPKDAGQASRPHDAPRPTTASQPELSQQSPEQLRLAAFESSASRILRNIAQNSRFVLLEATNLPQMPLPLLPGEEVDAAVIGTLPGGRTFVQVAGTALELVLPRNVESGDLLRLTYISSHPKPTFAIPRAAPESTAGTLSEAGRWLSVLEHLEGGVSDQQMYVLEKLNTVLKSLPPDSPAFTAILDEAVTYHTVIRSQGTAKDTAPAATSQEALPAGNGITLSDDMARLLQAIIKGNRLALLESLGQQTSQLGLAPGQQVKGEVLAALGGGRFSVLVAGQVLEFLVPKGVRRGDLINLFFITGEPQNMFLMTRYGKAGDSLVSETGRWLSGFLGSAAEQIAPKESIGILQTLLSEPPADAGSVGRTLQHRLSESGLFYESHLARWFGGEYPLDEILKEPQGRLSPRLMHPSEQASPEYTGQLSNLISRTGSAEQLESLFRKAGASISHEGIADQQTLPIVSQQLATLQNGQHVLRGDLFPGQPMNWTVAERDARRNRSGGVERSWETTVEIELPRLGAVNARLILEGTHVRVEVKAGDGAAALQLSSGADRLTGQLEAAGLTLADLNIRHVAP